MRESATRPLYNQPSAKLMPAACQQTTGTTEFEIHKLLIMHIINIRCDGQIANKVRGSKLRNWNKHKSKFIPPRKKCVLPSVREAFFLFIDDTCIFERPEVSVGDDQGIFH